MNNKVHIPAADGVLCGSDSLVAHESTNDLCGRCVAPILEIDTACVFVVERENGYLLRVVCLSCRRERVTDSDSATLLELLRLSSHRCKSQPTVKP